MTNIKIDHKRLAEYIKQHADELAAKAYVDLHIVKINSMAGETHFAQTIDVELSEIPLDEVEAN